MDFVPGGEKIFRGMGENWFFTERWGANKGFGEAPKSCTRKEHESATNPIAKRGQGGDFVPFRLPLAGSRDSVPCGVWGNAPTVPRPTNPKEAANKGAGSEASLPVTLRVLRRAPKLLYPQLAYCRAKWARPTSMGEGFLSMLAFFIAGEKRRAYPAVIENPRQPLDNRPCVLPGVLCSWKMCYACSNCELYSSA